jgi:hypothetical protein
MVLGCFFRHFSHEVRAEGRISSFAPVMGPVTASFFTCDQSDSVSVIHEHIVLVEKTGNAEGQQFTFHFPGVHDSRVGKRSPTHQDRLLSEIVIDHLVPGQNANRIGAGHTL